MSSIYHSKFLTKINTRRISEVVHNADTIGMIVQSYAERKARHLFHILLHWLVEDQVLSVNVVLHVGMGHRSDEDGLPPIYLALTPPSAFSNACIGVKKTTTYSTIGSQ